MGALQSASTDLKKLNQTLVLFADSKGKLLKNAASFDTAHKKIVSSALAASRFQGTVAETFVLPTPALSNLERVIVIGVGKTSEADTAAWRKVGIQAGKAFDACGTAEATGLVEGVAKQNVADFAQAFAEGVALSTRRFDTYKTKLKAYQKAKFKKLVVMLDDVHEKEFKKRVPLILAQTEGANLARDLVDFPPNVATPTLMVQEAKKLAKLGVKVKVLGEKEMTKLGMNLLLAVGQGAKEESRLIMMEWKGDAKSKDTSAIVGKGVMFDTGGYNLKPGRGMAMMKSDMAGAAAVMGTMMALAKRKAKVNVVGVVGCVMNMVSRDSFLPSDILTGYNGTTVEIGNTDAEGRLVLADAMAYTVETKKPKEIIDLATLTGACMGALGAHYAGLFSNNDKVAKSLTVAGDNAGERLWRLPIDAGYAAKATLADLNNDGSAYGGASTAAVFLQNFAGDVPWAHLDIAGVGMSEKIPGGPDITGASGFGVRLLVDYFDKR